MATGTKFAMLGVMLILLVGTAHGAYYGRIFLDIIADHTGSNYGGGQGWTVGTAGTNYLVKNFSMYPRTGVGVANQLYINNDTTVLYNGTVNCASGAWCSTPDNIDIIVMGGQPYNVTMICDSAGAITVGRSNLNATWDSNYHNSDTNPLNGIDYGGAVEHAVDIYFSTIPAPPPALNFTYINATYDALKYETDTTEIDSWVRINDTNVLNITGILQYNNTNYSMQPDVALSNATDKYFNTVLDLPLIETNATQVELHWWYEMERLGGVNETNTSSALNNQTIQWAYYIQPYNATNDVIQGYPVLLNATVWNYIGNATESVEILFNGTYYHTTNNTGMYWTNTATAPQISPYNQTFMSNATLTVNLSTSVHQRVSDYSNTTVYVPSLNNCTGWLSAVVAINYTLWDEEDYGWLDGNMSGTFTVRNLAGVYNETLNLTWTNTHEFPLCIYPPWANATVSSFQSYQDNASLFDMRHYFLLNASISNATSYINLFLLNTSYAMPTQVTVSNLAGQGVPDAYIHFMRYYVGQNAYKTVAMSKTDSNGNAITYLRPNDIWYRIQLLDGNGELIASFSPQTIPCDPAGSICSLDLQTEDSIEIEFYDYYDEVAYACEYVNATNTSACTFTDTSGLMKYANLTVYRIGLFTPELVCSTQTTSASATLTCPLGVVDGRYLHIFMAHFNQETLLTQFETSTEGVSIFGTTGLIMAALMVATLGLIGAFNPAVGILLSVIGLLIAFAMQLVYLEIGAVVGMVLVGAILIYKLKS